MLKRNKMCEIRFIKDFINTEGVHRYLALKNAKVLCKYFV